VTSVTPNAFTRLKNIIIYGSEQQCNGMFSLRSVQVCNDVILIEMLQFWTLCTAQSSILKRNVSQTGYIRPVCSAEDVMFISDVYTVDSLTALRLNRGNVFLKKKFYFP
jgi:hypothetical protein